MHPFSTRSARFRHIIALLGAFMLFGAIQAAAQTGNGQSPCLPGVPCVVNLTPNDPADDSDGPNAKNSPNYDKIEKNGENCGKDGTPCGACDADFMNQIYAKAYLEGQRETELVESTIRKPDSVLEYTCFDQLEKLGAQAAGPMFSETERWKDTEVTRTGYIGDVQVQNIKLNIYMGPLILRSTLTPLVLSSLNKYIKTNFGHSFLGGALPVDYQGCNTGYVCGYMDTVYYMAKCKDLDKDMFLSFDTLTTLDPRILPQACVDENGDPQTIPITGDLISVSKNAGRQYAAFDEDSPTYTELLEGVRGAVGNRPAIKCQDYAPIPTGVTVVQTTETRDLLGNVRVTNTQAFEDMVCPISSCKYNSQSKQCEP